MADVSDESREHALVKSLYELHGRHVRLESELGVGTEVVIVFPP